MPEHEVTYEVESPNGKVYGSFDNLGDATECAEKQAAKKLKEDGPFDGRFAVHMHKRER